MLTRFLLAVAALLAAAPASAQFYKDKTLTLLVNYAAGGNADVGFAGLAYAVIASFFCAARSKATT